MAYTLLRLNTRGGLYEALVTIDKVCGNVTLNFGTTQPTTSEIDSKVTAFTTNSEAPDNSNEPDQSPITELLNAKKERLKWATVNFIHENSSATAHDFVKTLTWQDAGIATTLISVYAHQAASQGLLILADDTFDTCYAALRAIILGSTDAQLVEML